MGAASDAAAAAPRYTGRRLGCPNSRSLVRAGSRRVIGGFNLIIVWRRREWFGREGEGSCGWGGEREMLTFPRSPKLQSERE